MIPRIVTFPKMTEVMPSDRRRDSALRVPATVPGLRAGNPEPIAPKRHLQFHRLRCFDDIHGVNLTAIIFDMNGGIGPL